MRALYYSRSIVLVLGVLAGLSQVSGESLTECHERGGLPNVFSKLTITSTNTVRIAYLGGSITAQEGWRPRSLKWFQEQFPAVKVEQIHAAIGGTGSDLGVFRLKRDVLDHDPDLLLVEFAVNDAGASPEQIHRCIEGIVRQTRRHNARTDVCFVYTLAGNMLETLQQGRLPRSMLAMEQIAEHYGIPSINMGLEVARLEQSGKLMFKGELPETEAEKTATGERVVFSPDGVHPYPETGHRIYAEAVARSMAKIRVIGRPGPQAMPAPFRADNWEHATMMPLSEAKRSPGWQRLDPAKDSPAKRFGNRLPEIWKAAKPGETISFKFRGTTAKVYDLLGPDCGQVIVKLDGLGPEVKPRFDAYCTYHRLATLNIAESLPDAVHRVELTIHAEQPDKARILSQRNEKIDDPKRYDGTTWYAGAILLVGELVE